MTDTSPQGDKMKNLIDQIRELLASYRVKTFTLEQGMGETYCHSKPVLYGHGRYPRSSVLAGRPSRIWIESWESWDEAHKAIVELQKAFGRQFKCEEMNTHSTYIPIDALVRHLPDDSDY